ncbi:MAG: GNAT family N-acetyltransferase [Mariniblastus sp.]
MESEKIESDPVLQTARLAMRPFEPADAPVIQVLLNDKEIASNTQSVDYPYPDGQALVWIENQIAKRSQFDSFVFGIHLRESDQLIGGIGLDINKKDHNAELGYWLGREFWNLGFCTEAVMKVLDFGFEELGLYKIHAHYLTRNPASGRVLDKVGMTHEGVLRGHSRKWGVFEDIAIYGMLCKDPRPWEK